VIRILFLRNLRHHAVLLAALWLGLALLELAVVRIGAQVETGPGIRAILEQVLPPQFRQALIGQLDMLSFAGLVGFGFQHPLVLTAAAAFQMVVATIPTAERESGLLDLILARPLPRTRYLLGVLVLLVTGALVFPAAVLGGAALGLATVRAPQQVSLASYVPAAVSLAALLLALAGGTLLLAARAGRRGVAAAQAAGLALGLYWMELLAELWKPLRSVRWLSPFHYFKPMETVVQHSVPWFDLAVLLGLFLACTALALVQFRRQDL